MATYEEAMTALRNAHEAGDTEAASRLAQIANGLKSNQSSGLGEDLSLGLKTNFAGVGNAVDNFMSMQAGSLVRPFSENLSDSIYKGMNEREQSRNEWANPSNKEVGIPGKVVGAVATLPMQVATLPFGTASTGKTAIDSGEGAGTAMAATGIDTVGNMAGLILGPGKTLFNTVLKNAGANAAQEYVTKWVNQQLMSTPEGQKAFTPHLADTIVAAIVGGGTAGVMHTPAKAPAKLAPSVDSALQELNGKTGTVTQPDPTTSPALGAMAEQLGYKEGENSPLNRPPVLSTVAGQLAKVGEEQRVSKAQEAVDAREAAFKQEADQRVAQAEMEANRAKANNTDSSFSPEHQAHLDEVATQKKLADDHAAAMAEQERIQQAQDAVEARQKALEDEMNSKVTDQSEARRLEELRSASLEKNAFLRNKQANAALFSEKEQARQAKVKEAEALAKRKEELVKERADHEALIQKIRDEHEASAERQRAAQDAINRREQLAADETARKTTLDLNAAERTRQEAAPTGYEHVAYENAIPGKVDAHPSVVAAEKRATTANAMVTKAHMANEKSGGSFAAQVKHAEKVAKEAEANVATARANVEKGLRENAPVKKSISRSGQRLKQGGFIHLSWGDGDGIRKLKGPMGNILKDIGNALIKSPEEAIKLAGQAKDVSQNIAQQGINLLTKGGTYLKAKVNHPVVHYAVDRFLDADSTARSIASQEIHNTYLPALRELSDSQRETAFKLLDAADQNQKPLTPEFLQRHGIDPKVASFIITHKQAMEKALTRINDALVSVDKKPITSREAYSAMNMTGDYRKVVYKTVDGQKTVVGVISANSKNGLLGKYGHSLESIQKSLLNKDSSYEFGPLQDMTQRTSYAKGTPHEAFQNVMETLGENNPHIKEFLDTLREVSKDDARNFAGMQQHTMQKKGVFGMEGRKPWLSDKENMGEFFRNQVQYLEGVSRWAELAKAAKDVNTVLGDEHVSTTQQNAVKLSSEYMSNAMGINPLAFGRGVESVFNHLFNNKYADYMGLSPSRMRAGIGNTRLVVNTALLSLNPSFLAIQAVQGSAAMPAMSALLRSRGLASSKTILTQGFDSMIKGSLTFSQYLLGDKSKLSTVEKEAIQFAKEKHIYAADMVEHANQIDKGAAYIATKVTQSPAAMLESSTRAQMFMGFVHMMHDAGLTKADGLFEQAHRMTDMAMNNYAQVEKPPIYNALGPIGSMAYNLKSFGHNEISRWSMFAREIGKADTVGGKLNASQALLTQMATTIAIAGVMGLPFYSQWESLYDLITAHIFKAPRSLTLDVMEASKALGKEIPSIGEFTLSHGTPTMLGMDVSKRIGLGDVLASKASDVAFAGGSKIGDIVSKGYGAATNWDEAHSKAFGLTLLPPILQGFAKDAWYTKDDKAYTMDPDKKPVVSAILNDRDKLFKKIGITGINESTQKESFYQLNKIEKAYTDMRKSALAKMAQDVYTSGAISERAMQKYLKGQGDPEAINAELTKMATEQGIPQNDLKIIQDAATKALNKQYDLERRTQ